LKALTGIFLEIGREVAKEYEGRIEMNDRIVDACAMQLVLDPWQFDVIVATNLFGDILSDEWRDWWAGSTWRQERTSGRARRFSRRCTARRRTSRVGELPILYRCCLPPR
jgi:hypothetical protein